MLYGGSVAHFRVRVFIREAGSVSERGKPDLLGRRKTVLFARRAPAFHQRLVLPAEQSRQGRRDPISSITAMLRWTASRSRCKPPTSPIATRSSSITTWRRVPRSRARMCSRSEAAAAAAVVHRAVSPPEELHRARHLQAGDPLQQGALCRPGQSRVPRRQCAQPAVRGREFRRRGQRRERAALWRHGALSRRSTACSGRAALS